MTSKEVPATVEQAAAVLSAASVPPEILGVTERLQTAGHAAVLVGGAIRDVLLGRLANDWDLATSATPQEVQATFRRTVPTGIEHGTVSVLVRSPDDTEWTPVEVTTFRGEGTYVDGRRPTEVTFLRDLEEDLARRDFTVNALAWDPVNAVFSDPFGGLQDLGAGVVRAVGDADRRFVEDGLRTMRAVRFCATRELVLDPETQAAIAGALSVLDQVSAERVLVELTKLLQARTPSRGLVPMVDTGIWGHVLPEVEPGALRAAIAAVDDMQPRVVPRLARLLLPRARGGADDRAAVLQGIEALKPSRQFRADVLALTSAAMEALEAALATADPIGVRRAMATLTRDRCSDALEVLGADETTRRLAEAALENAALEMGELAVRGRDLIEAQVVPAGPQVGEVLRALMRWVLEDPSRNERESLLQRARALRG